jgi:hypothetical protein
VADNNDFKNLANRAYVSYHQDGIIDILLGAGISGFGLQMLTANAAFMFLTWMPFLLYMPLKNNITAPRFGYVRFAGEQEERTCNTRLLLIGLLTFIAFAGLFVFLLYGRVTPEWRAFIGQYTMLLLGGLAALTLFLAGAVTGLKRLYLYAALTLLFNAAGTWLPIHEGWAVLLLGLVIMTCGFWLLVRFLRTYPRVDEEDGRAGQ